MNSTQAIRGTRDLVVSGIRITIPVNACAKRGGIGRHRCPGTDRVAFRTSGLRIPALPHAPASHWPTPVRFGLPAFLLVVLKSVLPVPPGVIDAPAARSGLH